MASINTNVGAQVALAALTATNSNLASVQKQISTGYRVADATDDGAAFAIAQRVRGDVGALTSANQQLGNVTGLLATTNTALTDVSNTLNSARAVLVKLADGNSTASQRTQYVSQFQQLVSQIGSYLTGAGYNTKNLLGGTTATGTSVNVIKDELGNQYTIAAFSGAALYTSLTSVSTADTATSTAATAALTTTGTFTTQLNKVADALNKLGSETNFVNNQISYNSSKINALNTGLGALIDADLAQESAKLQSLQIQQQLGTQSLTIANQAPLTLLKLFGG